VQVSAIPNFSVTLNQHQLGCQLKLPLHRSEYGNPVNDVYLSNSPELKEIKTKESCYSRSLELAIQNFSTLDNSMRRPYEQQAALITWQDPQSKELSFWGRWGFNTCAARAEFVKIGNETNRVESNASYNSSVAACKVAFSNEQLRQFPNSIYITPTYPYHTKFYPMIEAAQVCQWDDIECISKTQIEFAKKQVPGVIYVN
jgi:hypothetical protein